MKLLFTISLFFSIASFSQTIKVVNGKTGEGIPEVFVNSAKNPRGVLTDKNGKVDLSEFGDDEMIQFKHIQFVFYQDTKKDLVREKTIKLTEKDQYLPIIPYNYPLRYTVDKDDEAGQIESIPREIVKIENPATSADMLQNTGNVLVQKSQGGGGSPIIRGFEANKLLLVIDGVRMNNAIYRSGHLQNSITIDNSVLDHTEIIYGPSSSLYGSDALGGVIHFHTKDPLILNKDSSYFNGNAYVRYNTNNNGMTGHFNFMTGKGKWGVLSAITASRFGNIIMGSNRVLHGDSLWGLHKDIVVDAQAGDTMISNLDNRLQVGTSYTQYDFLQKVRYKPNNSYTYTLNLQYSTSSEIDRYDKLTEYDGSNLKFSEWYYGPQNRLFAQFLLEFNGRVDYEKFKRKPYNNGTLSIAYQRIDEDRISRRFQNANRIHQEEDLNILSINVDYNKVFTKSRALFYGIEVQHNFVNSSSFTEDIFNGNRNDAQTRYPSMSNYLTSGLYVEFKQKFKNNASFTAGLRYSLVYANSDFTDTTFISLPFQEVNFLTSAPSGNIGLVMRPDSVTRIRMLATSGFRAPNIDDYGKVFEKKGITVIPNDNLTPEYAIGSELGFSRSFFKDFVSISATAYFTYLFNAMVQRDFQLNGQDSILYDGEMTKIQAIVNTNNAIVYGTSAALHLNFTKEFTFDYIYNFTKGTDITANTPLEHIPPQFGKIMLQYKNDRMNTAFYTFYNFRKRTADYTAGGDNIDLTPNEGGTPAWWTLNYRFSLSFWKKVDIQVAVENILDVHYRQFASAISQPGRNIMLGVKAEF